MKAIITIEDTEDGNISVTGEVEGLPHEDALPSGAQIMHAYFNVHMAEITEKAYTWFRHELIARVAKSQDEVIQ